jgi:L,D-transpeptidase catalytic domain
VIDKAVVFALVGIAAAAVSLGAGPPPHAPPPHPAGGGFLLATAPKRAFVPLSARPRGRLVATASGRTEFGSPLVFSVVRRRRNWVAVTSSALPNGRLAWIDARRTPLRFSRTRIAISIDVTRRELYVRDRRRVVRRMRVAVGAPGSPTPTGRFAVTDQIAGRRYGSVYGCCILALSGHQPHTPAGWRDGNRLAIHGGDSATVGDAVSAGCLRARGSDLRYLMKHIRLGTPVFIYA